MDTEHSSLATAYHEAGHAVVALALGRPIHRVSIEPNEVRLGHCQIKKGTFRPSQDIVETEILILLAGIAAEARQTGEYNWDGATQDLRDIRHLVQMRAADARQEERVMRRMLSKAEHVLSRPGVWPAVDRIARELLRATTISGRAARHFFDEAVARAEREG